jgi:hypothetical protein
MFHISIGFCDCFSYRDSLTGKCMWCPYFVPMALCGTCFLLGKIRTLYIREQKCCCDMGNEGCLLCMISAPINIAGPFGGFCWFCCWSQNMRKSVSTKYRIKSAFSESCCYGMSNIIVLYIVFLLYIYIYIYRLSFPL